MDTLSDEPIYNETDDILKRDSFVTNLADSIISWDKQKSLVIGLYGKWGVAKTWSYIILVIDVLGINIFNKFPNFIPKIKYWVLFGLALLAALLFFSETLIKFLSIKWHEEKTLSEIKANINQKLLTSKKMVIIIDDIDRLSAQEMRQIFRIVKNNADFKNTIDVIEKTAIENIPQTVEMEKATLQTTLENDTTTPETTSEKIILLIRENPKITREELASACKISVDGIKWQLKKLKGKVLHTGPNKGGRWEIIGE